LNEQLLIVQKDGMEKVICVSTAKVPIVKIWDPELRLACDMNVNNTLALENTRMIKTYVEIDERIRPLAMIIKHWTKRRIVNDAAFGGTLSSYTWICMIINFLQTRKPPILPSLHQRPHQKLPAQNGKVSSFADDVEALKHYGKENKETLGELLFGFFRFYGHELDYDKNVISVRSGKLISKSEKNWTVGNNNKLCVEEPFNTSRNLGNTADDTSFRGLHIELRRAYDLISEANLEACCEEYVFPKEEEKIWAKPPPQPRPVLSRTPSSSGRGGRGGHSRGGGNRQYNKTSTGSRRASSGAFDSPQIYTPQNLPHNITPQEAWIRTQNAQTQLHNDLYTTFSVLQAQENSLRMQLFNQTQAYAFAQARLQGGDHSTSPQTADRTVNRANSFDNPPLTAPIRPDMYYYPIQFSQPPMYGQQTASTYPSSPSISATVPELRRSLHRSTITGGTGPSSGLSSSSLRSHSQPAARSVPSPLTLQGLPSRMGANGNHYGGIRPGHNVAIPTFATDGGGESSYEGDSLASSTATLDGTPPEYVIPRDYVGYYVNGSVPEPTRRSAVPPLAIPAFGESNGVRRRPSTDQFPQQIFDRIRRTSRSPSPMGHRIPASGPHSAPLAAANSQQHSFGNTLRSPDDRGPLVVNGSNYMLDPQRNPSLSESSVSGESLAETVTGAEGLFYPDSHGESHSMIEHQLQSGLFPNSYEQPNGSRHQSSVAPSGTNSWQNNAGNQTEIPVSQPALQPALSIPISAPAVSVTADANGSQRLSPTSRNRLARQQPQTNGMTPLDFTGLSHTEALRDDQPHLSPVYETRSPSPSASRKFNSAAENQGPSNSPVARDTKPPISKPVLKQALANSTQKQSGQAQGKSNGHTRGAKSESSTTNTWQKASKNKRKGPTAEQKAVGNGNHIQSEKLPKNDSERKGG
jgi:hypothetical protein